MTAHTLGPLTLGRWASASGGPEIQYTNGGAPQQVFHCQPMESACYEQNARRLVACWNALEDVPTEEIEGFMAHMAEVRADIGVVGRQYIERKDQLDAARALLADAVEAFDDFPAEDHEIADRIRTFLEPKP